MKCFYHPDVDAVGTCAQCSKTACRQCIEDVGGALLCAGCLSLHQQQAQYEEHVATVDRETTIQRAKTRILWSWIVGGIGIVFGIFPGLTAATDASQKNDLGPAAVILL